MDVPPGELTQFIQMRVPFSLTYSAINENLNLTFGYKSTLNDNAPDDLRMNCFMVSLVYGWNSLLEGASRLKTEK
jgi:hypothetical protein